MNDGEEVRASDWSDMVYEKVDQSIKISSIQKVIALLPDINKGVVRNYEYDSFGHVIWTEEGDKIRNELITFAQLFNFDWTEWTKGERIDIAEAFKNADVIMCGKLLFAFYRQDRFVENLLYVQIATGAVAALLERLKVLLEEMQG